MVSDNAISLFSLNVSFPTFTAIVRLCVTRGLGVTHCHVGPFEELNLLSFGAPISYLFSHPAHNFALDQHRPFPVQLSAHTRSFPQTDIRITIRIFAIENGFEYVNKEIDYYGA